MSVWLAAGVVAAAPDALEALQRQRTAHREALGLRQRAAAAPRCVRWRAARGRAALSEPPGSQRACEGTDCPSDPLAALRGPAGQGDSALAAPWEAAVLVIVHEVGALVATAVRQGHPRIRAAQRVA